MTKFNQISQPGSAKAERRKAVRRPTYLAASILEPQQGKISNCQVNNISRTGAKVSISGAATIPPVFWLQISGDADLRYCADVWRKDRNIGVDFAAERALREIEDELALARARLRLSDPERARASHWTAGHRPHHRTPG
jgi:hypothetical protein